MWNPITPLRSMAAAVWNATALPAPRAVPPAMPQGLAAIPDTAKPAAAPVPKPFFFVRWFSWLWSFVPTMPWRREQPAAPAPNPQPAPPQNPVVDHRPQMLQMLEARLAFNPPPEVFQAYQELGRRIGNGGITLEELEEAFANVDQVQEALNRAQNPAAPQAPVVDEQERTLMFQMLERKKERILPDGFAERYEAFRPRIANGEIDSNELMDALDLIDGECDQAILDAEQLAQAVAANLLSPRAAPAVAQISLEERGRVLEEFEGRLQPKPPEDFDRRYREIAQPIWDENPYTTGLAVVEALLAPIDQDLAQYHQDQAAPAPLPEVQVPAVPAEQGTPVEGFLKVNQQLLGQFCNGIPGIAARKYRMGHIPEFIKQVAVDGNLVNPELRVEGKELIFTFDGISQTQLDINAFTEDKPVNLKKIDRGWTFGLPE